MAASALFLLKLILVPVLVAIVSLIARRWGAIIGGLLMGLPWMTGPVLLILSLEKGVDWSHQASVGATAAPIAICGYLLCYGWLAHRAPPLVCLLVAVFGFLGVAYAMTYVTWTLVLAAVAGAGTLLLTRVLLPKPRTNEPLRPLPWWDIPTRMVAAGLMVVVLNEVADIVGPNLSGIAASFPVILTSIVLFMHWLSGPDAVIRMLMGLSVSLLAFVAFFTVAAALVQEHGPWIAYGAAIIVGLTSSAVIVFTVQARETRRSANARRRQRQ